MNRKINKLQSQELPRNSIDKDNLLNIINSFTKLSLFVPLFFCSFFQESAFSQSQLSEIEEQIENLIIEENEAQGLEIYITHKSKELYHKTWGWQDDANNVELKENMVYNIRSMTKPMIGTLIHIYSSKEALDLDDPVSKYLPSFDNPICKNLTIREMLLHRAGYIQGMPGKSWRQYSSLKTMVEYWGSNGPQNPGNKNWSYSDAHADILARLLEVVSGKSLQDLFQGEIFNKLEMYDTYSASSNSMSQNRIMPLYKGSKGSWSIFWRPEDGAFYPFSMGAQSVFSTSKDYAKYMYLYMNNGLFKNRRILTAENISKTFQNRDTIAVPPGLFPLAETGSLFYGHFWGMINFDNEPESKLPDVFMHQGSDGTAAYAFPNREVVVVVMTQSRGTKVLPKIEELILPLVNALEK